MESERQDCTWCGSARSIDHGICQVCLMEYPLGAKILRLPLKQKRLTDKVIRLRDTANADSATSIARD